MGIGPTAAEPVDIIKNLPFWANFVHHLRNSIGTISSVADFCRSYPVDQDKLLSIFAHIGNSAQKAMIHVDEFTRLLRPLQVRTRVLPLEEWLRPIVALHPINAAAGVAVKWHAAKGRCEVRADPVWLQRAVWAVLDNCLDAMPEGGVLTVKIGKAGRKVRLGFSNTGAAIAPSVRHQAWEPFFTTKADKIGSGLTWVRKIANSHHCRFGLQSSPKGGVETWLEFPPTGGRRRHGRA